MTILFQTGFESGPGSMDSIFTDNVPVNQSKYIIQNSVVKNGNWAFKFDSTGGPSDGPVKYITSSSTIVYRKWWWVPPTLTGGSGNHMWRISRRSGVNNLGFELDPVVGGGASWGIDILGQLESPVIDDQSRHGILTLPLSQWFYFEALFSLNTGGLANGVMKFAINGALVYSDLSVLYVRVGSSMIGFDTFLLATNWETAAGPTKFWYEDDVIITDNAADFMSGVPGTNQAVIENVGLIDTSIVSGLLSSTLFSDDYESDKSTAYFKLNSDSGTWDRSSVVVHNGSFARRSIKAAGTSGQGECVRIGACPPNTGWPPFPSDADQIAHGIDYTSKFQDVTLTFWHQVGASWVDGDVKLARFSGFGDSIGGQFFALHVWSDDADPMGIMLDCATSIAGAGSAQYRPFPNTGIQDLSDTVMTAQGWNDFAHLDFFASGRTSSKPYGGANKGTWIQYDVRCKLNTIGIPDGAAELWINGIREVNLTGLNWRSSYNTYGINVIHLERYWNVLAAAGNTSYFDELVIRNNVVPSGPFKSYYARNSNGIILL